MFHVRTSSGASRVYQWTLHGLPVPGFWEPSVDSSSSSRSGRVRAREITLYTFLFGTTRTVFEPLLLNATESIDHGNAGKHSVYKQHLPLIPYFSFHSPHPPLLNTNMSSPKLYHNALKSTFCGIEPALSTPDAQIHQYLGIQYATVPARFRQSKLRTSYPPITDATAHGSVYHSQPLIFACSHDVDTRPISPQVRGGKTAEELLFGISADEIPQQTLKHDEFECLNLNITCPAGLTPHSRIPVMLWVHG